MTNVTFAKGTTVPTIYTSGFDDGCIYFNTSDKKIYLRDGNLVSVFNGNDSVNYVDDYKMCLLKTGTTSITNPGAVAIDDYSSGTISILGIIVGWRSSGSGSNHKCTLNEVVINTQNKIATNIKFASSFSGKGTATFTYYYIPTA